MITIYKATQQDVEAIVRIHLDAFKNFFLSSLGKKFLKLYYFSFIKSKRSVIYCAKEDNILIGFSACSYQSKGFNKNLIKENVFRYGYEFFRLLLTRPSSLLRLMRNMNKNSNTIRLQDDGNYAELYSIAVSPTCQGKGIGRLLLLKTENDIQCYNQLISLTTDYYNNEKTISFYHSLGYKDFYDFITYPNRRMWRMIKQLK